MLATCTCTTRKREWKQERFARAFEEYLRSGKAPSASLKRAFQQFKKWLCKIYKNIQGEQIQAGAKASPEVEAVMARMVASEEMIEAMAEMEMVQSMEITEDMSTDEVVKMHERWKEEDKKWRKEKWD